MDRESQSSKPRTCVTRYKEIIFICILWEYRLRTFGSSLKLSASVNINTIWLVNFLKSTSGLFCFVFFLYLKQNSCFTKENNFVNKTNSTHILPITNLQEKCPLCWLTVGATNDPHAGHESFTPKCFFQSNGILSLEVIWKAKGG